MDFPERSLAVLHFPEPLLEFGSAKTRLTPTTAFSSTDHT
jgi:hypothetical protein